MYARLVRFGMGAGKRSVAKSLADDLAPEIARQKGCQSVTVFGDDATGEHGIFVLWASEADVNAAAQIIRPKLEQHLSGHLQSPPDAALFEVIAHQAST